MTKSNTLEKRGCTDKVVDKLSNLLGNLLVDSLPTHNAAGSILNAAASKLTTEIQRSPDVLDMSTLERWFQGSIWALLGINLLAFGLFLAALLDPQLRKGWQFLTDAYEAYQEKRRAAKEAKAVAPKTVVEKIAEDIPPPPEVIAEPTASAPSPEPVTTAEASSSVEPPAKPEPSAQPEPEVTDASLPSGFHPAPAETAPTEPSVAAPEPEPELPKAEAVEPEPSAQPEPSQAAPAPEPSAAIPEPSALPETVVSAETKPSAMESATAKNKASFDQQMKELLDAPTDHTDELPIFDTSLIDQAIKEDTEIIDPKAKT